MDTIAFVGSQRSELGKKAARQARREGKIPCVLYGGDEIVHFTTTLNDVKKLLYTADFRIAEIEIEGKKYRAIVKDWQAHPLTDSVVHIDFLQMVPGRKINIEVPVRFRGSSPGEKLGGKLLQSVRRVKIKTTPEKLVDSVTLDISSLELGQSIRIRDIDPIEGIEIMNGPSIPVAMVEIPRALRSAEAAKEATAETEEATA